MVHNVFNGTDDIEKITAVGAMGTVYMCLKMLRVMRNDYMYGNIVEGVRRSESDMYDMEKGECDMCL